MKGMVEKMTNDREERTIFALDIGTRSVIGIVGHREGDLFHVECVEREEYKKRAVVDGQIEDIGETAKIAGAVKDRLEAHLGRKLRQVHIAAAGRVLRTVETQCESTVEDGQNISVAFIARLEQSAVQKAYETLFREEDRDTSFFCVGHAVKSYTLDGYHLSSLLDHRGQAAGVELIATFLPREVVESLYTTMARIGLTVAGLTLEPIAAMNAVIPEDLRRLNLALVDIGAGTSDIALCAGGGVSAYTMATVAGDEITEALMESCLVDFQTAETIKKQLGIHQEGHITYTDILGFPHEAEGNALADLIRPAIETLATEISSSIVQANGKAPAAVFLVGGGSRTPMLCSLVAKGLGIENNRVAVGGNNYMQRMLDTSEEIFGPEFATPAGIALTAAQEEGDVFSVTVNGEKLRMVDGWDTSVLGILQLAGFRYSQIMGRAGKGLSYQVNGVRRTLRGGLSEPSAVAVNDSTAVLTDIVTPGDMIAFVPAQPGADAAVRLDSLPEFAQGQTALVNGEPREGAYFIHPGDEIVIEKEAQPSLPQEDEWTEEDMAYPAEAEQEEMTPMPEEIQSAAEPIAAFAAALPALERPEEPVHRQETIPGDEIHITLNGGTLTLERRADGTPYQFFDILSYTNIDPRHPQGAIVQRLNGCTASYLEPLREGDQIEIYWDEGRENAPREVR